MNTTYRRALDSSRPEELSQAVARVKDLLLKVNDAADAFSIAWRSEYSSILDACEARDTAYHHLFIHLGMLEGATVNLLQSLCYPCNKLPPAQVKPQIKPPESLIEGTVLAELFGLYATCMRLTNPDDLGHQLQPEARQLINDAIYNVRWVCEQPTAKD